MDHLIITVGLASFVMGAAVATIVCLLAIPKVPS